MQSAAVPPHVLLPGEGYTVLSHFKHGWSNVLLVELETKVCEDFTIIEKPLLGPSPG